jgi:hypothetical protein
MRSCTALLLALAAGLAACGGSTTTRTVTETKTVTVTAPGSAQAAPQGDSSAAPLPAGVVAIEGTYAMRTRKADYTGENTTVDDEYPTDSEWIFKTSCQGDACTVAMRRELGSGAFKNLTLQPDPERENVYAADTSGTTDCANGGHTSPTTQHYSLKLGSPVDVGGRQTARLVDAYFTETAHNCTYSDNARGVVSWRGKLKQ